MRIVLKLTNTTDYNIFMSRENGAYTVKLSKNLKHWYMEFCDMLGFYQHTDIEVEVIADVEDIKHAEKLYGNHSYKDCFLRNYESKVLVHSTTIENARSILNDKKIKSWNILRQEKNDWEARPIGSLLGDIDDFSNYVMLSGVNQNNEIISASKQFGRIIMDDSCEYIAGARFYLDAERLAKDGLILRDGVHLKVKDFISLSKYMIWYSTADILGINGKTTPKKFMELSNKKFFEFYPEYK